MKEKLLIIDNNPVNCSRIQESLSEHYQVFVADVRDKAIFAANLHRPKLILVNVDSQTPSDVEFCKELRRNPVTEGLPVIALSDTNESVARIAAFSAGVDDFISKPYEPEELITRVQGRIARFRDMSKSIMLGELSINFDEIRVEYRGKSIDLGHVEFRILSCLAKNSGRIVEREQLNSFVWGKALPSSRALDPHITSLRKKLKETSVELRTVYGRGYSVFTKSRV